MSVHALLSLADRLFVINFGQKLAEGEPHAVMNDPKCGACTWGWRR